MKGKKKKPYWNRNQLNTPDVFKLKEFSNQPTNRSCY